MQDLNQKVVIPDVRSGIQRPFLLLNGFSELTLLKSTLKRTIQSQWFQADQLSPMDTGVNAELDSVQV